MDYSDSQRSLLWDDNNEADLSLKNSVLFDNTKLEAEILKEDSKVNSKSWFGLKSNISNPNKQKTHSRESDNCKNVLVNDITNVPSEKVNMTSDNKVLKAENDYKELYELALIKITNLESIIENLEKKISDLKCNSDNMPTTAEFEKITGNLDCDLDLNAQKESSYNIENRDQILSEERQRRAKLNAKKLAESRKRGSKRITSSSSSSTRKVLNEISTNQNQIQNQNEVMDSKNPELIQSNRKNSDSNSDIEWDDNEDKIQDKQNISSGPSVIDPESKKDDLDWTFSDDEVINNNVPGQSNTTDNDDDDSWFSDDDEKAKESIQANNSSSINIHSSHKDNNKDNNIDNNNDIINLEAIIDNNVKQWAQGKNIIDLLHTVRMVYHGPICEPDSDWNAAYNTGAINASHIRKAYL